MDLLSAPVSTAKGVGPKREEQLGRMGIETVRDLVLHLPASWEVRPEATPIAAVRPGTEVVVEGEVAGRSFRFGRGRRRTLAVELDDGTGRLTALFFQQAYLADRFPDGRQVKLWGRVDDKGRLAMPRTESEKSPFPPAGERVPVYPVRDGIGRGWLRALIHRTLDEVLEALDERLGEADLERLNMAPLGEAVAVLHRPGAAEPPEAARRRLAFEELLRLARARERRRRARAGGSAPALAVDDALHERILARFPFQPTSAQSRVIGEIRRDLGQAVPMARLLQGDVGSGKTVVAVSALLAAVQGGYQGALMAPTEVLAEQHHLGVAEMLDGITVDDPATLLGQRPLKVELLTNRTTTTERRRIGTELVAGGIDVLIGTHALIQEGVRFGSLGMVVIDEQHRFGVEQRAALREKNDDGTVPDVLVMTATPIPRTAAMTVYGDLDVSVLDEMPPGRNPIATSWHEDDAEVWPVVRGEVEAGRQAYVVCPLIEESENLEVRSAEEAFTSLSDGELAGLRVGLLHGRVGRSEKEKTMRLFRSGALDVLVATTVIEVGVDVPNATVMVVLDAARFGIAQLHQLRGRVGRGEHASRCLLVGKAPTSESEERIRAVVRTTDGFELAEVDLDLRGEGTIMGERQKGRNDLRLASLRRDREWVVAAREEALRLVGGGEGLADHPELADEVTLFLGEDESGYLLKS